jgi:hypothetical protein
MSHTQSWTHASRVHSQTGASSAVTPFVQDLPSLYKPLEKKKCAAFTCEYRRIRCQMPIAASHRLPPPPPSYQSPDSPLRLFTQEPDSRQNLVRQSSPLTHKFNAASPTSLRAVGVTTSNQGRLSALFVLQIEGRKRLPSARDSQDGASSNNDLKV